jgi:hypothetical protein
MLSLNYKRIYLAAGILIGGGLLIWKFFSFYKKNRLTEDLTEEERREFEELEQKKNELEKR